MALAALLSFDVMDYGVTMVTLSPLNSFPFIFFRSFVRSVLPSLCVTGHEVLDGWQKKRVDNCVSGMRFVIVSDGALLDGICKADRHVLFILLTSIFFQKESLDYFVPQYFFLSASQPQTT